MMNRINWTELKPQIQQVGRLSLPAILTQITTIAMQYIDSAMVGALGANASAAIGLVSSTTWLLSGTIIPRPFPYNRAASGPIPFWVLLPPYREKSLKRLLVRSVPP